MPPGVWVHSWNLERKCAKTRGCGDATGGDAQRLTVLCLENEVAGPPARQRRANTMREQVLAAAKWQFVGTA